MSSTLRQLSRELREQYSGLSIFLSESFINRALEETHQRRLWSHLIEEGWLTCPDAVATGTVGVTQGSRIATFDATAQSSLATFGTNPLISKCQFRIGSEPIYSIIAYDAMGDAGAHPWNTGATAGAMLLDKPYQGTTDSDATYKVFRCYFDPPLYYDVTSEAASVAGTYDFLRFISVRDMQLNFPVGVNGMGEELNRIDIRRTSSGNARSLYTYKSLATGVPLFELWPHQSSRKSYQCLYQRRGKLLDAPSDALPMNIPASLILAHAHVAASKWAIKNQNVFPQLKAIRWGDSILAHQREYDTILERTKKQDEEMVMRNWILPPEAEWGPMIGAQYTIDHASYAYTL